MNLDVHYRLDARSQPQNTGIFDVMPEEKRLQNHFDYELDLYRNIDKLKYTDKHVTDAQAKEKKKEMVEKRKDIRVRIYKEHGYKFLPRESFSYKY